MSVKELIFDYCKVYIKNEIVCFELKYKSTGAFALDRSQAHLLMLFLQEHLNSTISNELDEAITNEIKNKPKDIMG